MIAQRFRALGWAAGIASASTGLYLISLQVAAERAKLDDIDRRISAAHRDMQSLKTELSTRASYRQLEKWNQEDLTMAAPTAAQYFKSEAQLASLSPESLEPVSEAAAPRTQLASATVAPAAPATSAAPVTTTVAEAAPVAPQFRHANFVTPPADTLAVKPQRVTVSASVKMRRGASEVPAKPQRVAMVARPALDNDILGALVRTAAQERSTRP